MQDFALKVLTALPGKTQLFFVGQAGYIIKSKSGQLLGIDLYLSDCVERSEGHIGFKRMLPKILYPFELSFDAIISTHAHFDHFDIDSIPILISDKRTTLFASSNCEKLVEKLYLKDKNIIYVKPGENYDIGDFHLHFVNCDHGLSAPDAVGVIIYVDEKIIYETGDTCLRLDRVKEYQAFGKIDVMIAPINGAYGNLNEKECAKFSDVILPKLTIPCHYGMFASHGGNPGYFINIMKEQYPNNNFLIMSVGESLIL